MWVYFDTSAINALADDPDSAEVVRRTLSVLVPRVSSVNVIEVANTSNPTRRRRLMELLSELLHGSRPLEDPIDITIRQMRACPGPG